MNYRIASPQFRNGYKSRKIEFPDSSELSNTIFNLDV